MKRSKNKVAFIHRYGLEGWVCCGGHAVPEIIEQLSTSTDVHFYGPKTMEAHDVELRSKVRMHELPYTWNRANPNDKITKTLLWYLWLPILGIHCRIQGIRLIWNDETVPLAAPILRLFYGKNVAITVMDFFVRIYTEKHPRLRWVSGLIERIDFAAWRKLPLIFTKVLTTQEFLAEHGVSKNVLHLYRNPVDPAKFHPVDESTRKETRQKLGLSDADIVLSHHGILHPNKGNDWIFQCLEKLKNDLPNLKFLLIGDGPEMEPLKQLAEKSGLVNRIVFAGWLPTEEELNNALASSDIGLVMRIGQETDHFHMTDTLAHEMACGKPILAVNLKGIAEVIRDGENGFLFSTKDRYSFQDKLRTLVQTKQLRETYGAQALAACQEISSTETIAENMTLLLGTAHVQ